ncbi:transporter substrate-binding domain-containing protein [Aestuariibacter halophilus]|uniref:Transporter substrate-binding domain-containing protein n=1 Tax=Fluctibacter halophilus TaxID=226011 RepID=A0ABS8GAX3_9ALTE|nr:transporter substrate-binding domain-containing protein [Aestuariibacter halophilus]MCC2617740.1 transporter substrate-binding domain-containing protein [Aestuariibacter halophilus]
MLLLQRALLSVCLLLFAPRAMPSDTTLRVVIGDVDYPPYYVQQQGTLTGLGVRLLDAIVARTDLSYTVTRRPWSRMLSELADGQHDLMLVLYKTPARQQQFVFLPQAYAQEPIVLVCQRPCPIKYTGSLSTLQSHFVTVTRNYSYGQHFDKARHIQRDFVETEELLFSLMAKDKIPLTIVSLPRLLCADDVQQILPHYRILKPNVSEEQVHFALSKSSRDAAWFTPFSAAYLEVVRSPEFARWLRFFTSTASSSPSICPPVR